MLIAQRLPDLEPSRFASDGSAGHPEEREDGRQGLLDERHSLEAGQAVDDA